MNKIYIAGPMKGMPNFDHFHKAEVELKKAGWVCFNPASLPHSESMTPQQYMDIDLAMLRHCGAIYMLNGWKESVGATLEYHFALNYKIKIYNQGDYDAVQVASC